MDKGFEEFWKVKPRRKGSNPKALALKSFLREISKGATAEQIILAAREWCELEKQNGKIDTEYVPMASTWLNQKRFEDFKARSPNDFAWHDATAAKHGWKWNGEKYVRVTDGENQTTA